MRMEGWLKGVNAENLVSPADIKFPCVANIFYDPLNYIPNE
jgi:hypothetical protein